MSNTDILFVFVCLILAIMGTGVISVVGMGVYEYLMEMNGD